MLSKINYEKLKKSTKISKYILNAIQHRTRKKRAWRKPFGSHRIGFEKKKISQRQSAKKERTARQSIRCTQYTPPRRRREKGIVSRGRLSEGPDRVRASENWRLYCRLIENVLCPALLAARLLPGCSRLLICTVLELLIFRALSRCSWHRLAEWLIYRGFLCGGVFNWWLVWWEEANFAGKCDFDDAFLWRSGRRV